MTLFVNAETGELVQSSDVEVGPKPVLSPEQLLEQLTRLNKEINVRKSDIKQLIQDNKYNKKTNPQGIDGKEVKQIAKTAVRHAAADYEEKKLEQLEFFAAYERLTGYND